MDFYRLFYIVLSPEVTALLYTAGFTITVTVHFVKDSGVESTIHWRNPSATRLWETTSERERERGVPSLTSHNFEFHAIFMPLAFA